MNIKAGNFYFYGEWHPESNESLNLFLDEINKNEEAFVCIDDADSGMVGVVSTFPEQDLGVTVFGSYKDISTVVHEPSYYESLFF
ncbi:TPA: hypothetical protein ACSTL1_001157 [Serratia fonticola]